MRRPAFPLSLSIGWRYLRGRSALVQGTARAALTSTLLGVAAMVIAMALMTGYTEDLQRKLIGGSAAIVAYPLEGAADTAAAKARLEEIPEVVSVARVSYGQGSLSRRGDTRTYDVTLRGVEPVVSSLLADPALIERRGRVAGAVLGASLVERLGVSEGDPLTLLAIDPTTLRFHYLRLRLSGSFETGFAEADSNWVVLDRQVLADIGAHSTLLEITVENPLETEAVKLAAAEVFGADFLVSDWREFNRELFTALWIQKWGLFGVLALIVVVSTFNIASSLVVLTRERQREIGVLSAMGMAPRQIRSLFAFCGLVLGTTGALLGIALGWSVSWILTTFELIQFDDPGVAEIYFISSVPFRVELGDVLAILAFSLVATLVACLLPARRAAALLPAEALRYE